MQYPRGDYVQLRRDWVYYQRNLNCNWWLQVQSDVSGREPSSLGIGNVYCDSER